MHRFLSMCTSLQPTKGSSHLVSENLLQHTSFSHFESKLRLSWMLIPDLFLYIKQTCRQQVLNVCVFHSRFCCVWCNFRSAPLGIEFLPWKQNIKAQQTFRVQSLSCFPTEGHEYKHPQLVAQEGTSVHQQNQKPNRKQQIAMSAVYSVVIKKGITWSFNQICQWL